MTDTDSENAFWAQSALSFLGQSTELVVPTKSDELIEIPLGFQPHGITSIPLPKGGDRVAITNYYGPAVCIADLDFFQEGYLCFKVSWMRGAMNGITSCRGGFPDILPHIGANRCYTAFFDGKGNLWVGRGDRDFYVLAPPSNEKEKWKLVDKVSLPKPEGEWRDVLSANLFSDSRLRTVEANGKLDHWECCEYILTFIGLSFGFSNPTEIWHYGCATSKSRSWVTVADFRSSEAGIYVGSKRLVSDVNGTGICPLSNGGALVSRYGESHHGPFNGIPGALVYVPPSLLSGVKWVR